MLSSQFLILLGCVLAATASVTIVPGPKAQKRIVKIEEDLNEAEFFDAPLEFEDDDDDSVEERGLLDFFRKKVTNTCSCEGLACECCANMKVLGFSLKGCINAAVSESDETLNIGITAMNHNIFSRSFSMEKAESLCGKLPGVASFLGFCFNTEITKSEAESTISACSNLDVKVGESPAAVFSFSCVQLKEGKISFGNFSESEDNYVVRLKIKNPIKAAIDLIKKLRKKE